MINQKYKYYYKQMASIPTSFNPSDYQFLLKSLSEGTIQAKAQSLKRFNTLVTTDKKQFSIYAKRVVLSIQELLLEPKEDVNLLASTLALQIINLNPKEIQYYVRTKLLKNLIRNLGDNKPQIRKTSHYCLLAYVKTYKTFDQLIPAYAAYGFNSDQWQLRQKSINSFQSILIMEMKYLNWGSGQFRRFFQLLMSKLKDQNQYVQKAAEQCLLSLCKIDDIVGFAKKLQSNSFNVLREFCQLQKQLGNLTQNKLDANSNMKRSDSLNSNYMQTHRTLSNAGQSLLNFEKPKKEQVKLALINRIDQIRRNSQTPRIPQPQNDQNTSKSLKKVESVALVPIKKQAAFRQQKPKQESNKFLTESNKKQQKVQKETPKKQSNNKPVQVKNIVLNHSRQQQPQKIQAVLGRRLIDDLKNQKDWKVRLEAVQQLQTRFEMHKDNVELDSLSKTFMPTLVKLLTDPNFKVALISLKIIEQILQFPSTSLTALVPQLVDKLSDSKIALRQNMSKLIRSEYSRTKERIWIDNLLHQINKNPNSSIKQEILTILIRMYEQGTMKEYPFEEVIQIVCPLMQDLKTKIKIKTLDLLVSVAIKTEQIENIKGLVSGKMNQVYYQMYIQKIAKQLKNHPHLIPQKVEKPDRTSTNVGSRRYAKNSGNTTSTSLQRYSHTQQQISSQQNRNRNSSFLSHNKGSQILNPIAMSQQRATSQVDLNVVHKEQSVNEDDEPMSASPRKKQLLKSFKRKAQKSFDFKANNTNYSSNGLPPFNEPEKQLKNIMTQLKSEDWQTSHEALTKLRRVIENHSSLLNHSVVRLVIPEVMRLVESLRSSLSKNAVLTLNEMSNKLKRVLDTELDMIFNKLIKKTLDANSFISEEVKKSLVAVCSNSNQSRIVGLLHGVHTSRALPIKLVTAYVIQNIVFLPKFYQKQLDKIVHILIDFMSQGSIEIRQKTKSILNSLIQSEKGATVWKMIPSDIATKLQKRNDSIANFNSSVNVQVNQQSKRESQLQVIQIPRKKKKQKIISFPIQFGQIESCLEKCQSSDWKVRLQSMSSIYRIIEKYPQQSFQYRLSSKIVDVLSQQINDLNAKVAANALRIFIDVTRTVPQMIQYNLCVVCNELFNCFASNKPQIKDLSFELFQTITQNVENWMLLQHLCNGCLYGVQKSRPIIIQKLASIIGEIYKKKPNIFQKNVYSTINKLAQENRPDLASSLIQLLQAANEAVGPSISEYLKPKAKQLFNEYVNTKS